MNKLETDFFVEKLKNFYPEATCSLDFTTPFEMVVRSYVISTMYGRSC